MQPSIHLAITRSKGSLQSTPRYLIFGCVGRGVRLESESSSGTGTGSGTGGSSRRCLEIKKCGGLEILISNQNVCRVLISRKNSLLIVVAIFVFCFFFCGPNECKTCVVLFYFPWCANRKPLLKSTRAGQTGILDAGSHLPIVFAVVSFCIDLLHVQLGSEMFLMYMPSSSFSMTPFQAIYTHFNPYTPMNWSRFSAPHEGQLTTERGGGGGTCARRTQYPVHVYDASAM